MFIPILLFVNAFAMLVHALPTPPPQQIVIQVGGNSTSPGGVTQFYPNLVLATNGTIVTFQFTGTPGNHSVTQSSFGSPCQPLDNGFDSGWVFVNQSLPSPPEWNLTITNDQIPIWFYCKQLGKAVPHCNSGMVGVINVDLTAKSFPQFHDLASAATSVPPGQAEGGFVGIGASATGPPTIPSGATYFNNAISAANSGPANPTPDGGGAPDPNTTSPPTNPGEQPTSTDGGPQSTQSSGARSIGTCVSTFAAGLVLGVIFW
ncbi:hypothetical protein B0H13DRAFT_608217 [Mycena leptocephala]|nr:hypothetical protein B0H13DRAFT_608217 [Mycena leptocephala]